ncbi:hypothetical protein ANN_04388 [Periplaneta americana]|uniref:Uncharacterized protein n=1 Tax=Periplaneta americana TaxID=6978 RepID=A0ABQ8T8F5_PERAM|nr:hypothetical protein ANN_04388 [Periplaneta americana]
MNHSKSFQPKQLRPAYEDIFLVTKVKKADLDPQYRELYQSLKATGVTLSAKALACRSGVAFGRGSIPAMAD